MHAHREEASLHALGGLLKSCEPRRQVRDVGPDASWRTSRIGHYDFIQRQLDNGAELCPLFNVPWFSTSCFRLDWLHIADQGITADFMASLFVMLVGKMPGRSKEERTNALWQRIQQFYSDNQVKDRLNSLVFAMIKQQGKYPKLRASAAQVRALVPFAHQCAQQLLSRERPMEEAAISAMHHLHQCYASLSHDGGAGANDSNGDLADTSTKCAAQFVALEAVDGKQFRVKPKLHMFLELCMENGSPAKCWTYRDEDFGGSCAKFARRRCGLLSVKGTSTAMLTKFRMQAPVVRIKA